MSGKSYRDLEVWKKAMNLVVDFYNHTNHFPKTESYGLASQLSEPPYRCLPTLPKVRDAVIPGNFSTTFQWPTVL
jgi:hypothetical protein